jgi:hypothetical protein
MQGRRQGPGAARAIINERRHRRVCEQRPKSRPTEKREKNERRQVKTIGMLYKNDDKLCACTVDIGIDVCLLKLLSQLLMMMSMSKLMGWTAPTFLNVATTAIEVRAQMLLVLLLLLLQSLRDAFHPCVRRRLALGNEKARLRRLFIPRGKNCQHSPKGPRNPTRSNRPRPWHYPDALNAQPTTHGQRPIEIHNPGKGGSKEANP